MFITILNDKITGIYDGDKKKVPLRKGEVIQDITDNFQGQTGMNTNELNNDGTLKPLKQRIDEKIVVLQDDEKLEDNRIVKKSDIELMKEGLKEIPPEMKLEDDNLIPKTFIELYNDGLKTKKEYNNHQSDLRKAAYRKELDPMFFDMYRKKVTQEEYDTKEQEIKERFPYET